MDLAVHRFIGGIMKIGYLTLDSRSYNYGGVLQEFALFNVLNNYGETTIIDYDITTEHNIFSIKRSILNLNIEKIFNSFLKAKSVYRKDLDTESSELIKKRKLKFDEFRDKNLKLTKRFTNDELNEVNSLFDVFVCGSDQIWNPDYCVPSFFLSFTDKKKLIYAASIGKDNLSKRQIQIYSKLINKVDYVSVREESALFLEKYVSNTINLVLDPTLLIASESWKELVVEHEIQDYIFCYFLDITEEKINSVKSFAKRHNLKIVTIPFLHNVQDKSLEFGDYHLAEVGPSEFLGLIKNAQCVITDSFHASVFSLQFNKCFYVFGRQSGTYNMNTRIETLLGYFDQINRLIKEDELEIQVISDETYNFSNIEKLKIKSIQFIEQIYK